ncbi:TraR/DksA C4-type zinc finger protein [Candidatus Microgenomates bacterium]|nr:TraR/DksA C4-type zinc finger protein [Candidatus Microgenomates bacterium]
MVKKTKSQNKTAARSREGVIQIPSKLLQPIAAFLSDQLSHLEKRAARVSRDDPFKDTRRLLDNASPDTDAAEQFGHAQITAIKSELDRKIIQTKKALTRVKIGKYGICENCGNMIDTDRLMVYPEATLCVNCGKKREK